MTQKHIPVMFFAVLAVNSSVKKKWIQKDITKPMSARRATNEQNAQMDGATCEI
jgi:hypothetical protein